MKFNISRRDLIKITGLGTAGVVAGGMISGCANQNGTTSGDQKIKYNNTDLEVIFDTDVCVVGGGPSGVAAAVTAGKSGAKTVIVERGIQLGGLQTLGNVIPCMTTWCPNSDTSYVTDLKAKLTAKGLNWKDNNEKSEVAIWTNPEILPVVYDEMCTDAKVDILYNATLVDTIVNNKNISYCIVQTISGLRAIKSKTFIDCSGDAIMARSAGVAYEKGFEKTGNNQPMSFRFEMGGVDLDKVYQYVTIQLGDDFCPTAPPHYEFAEARHRAKQYVLEDFMVKGIQSGELTEEDAEYMQAFAIVGKPGAISMNCPELPLDYSASDPVSYSKGVIAGRQMINRIANYFIKHMPGFENAYLAKEASMLGARESFRIVGKYYLIEDDYHNQSRFEDAVARTAWFIDAHGEKVSEKLPKGAFYEIPYRSLITNEINNLIVAGRCISASFILQASMRIQLTCMSIGQAAGVAAAWATSHNTNANDIKWDELPDNVRSYTTATKTNN